MMKKIIYYLKRPYHFIKTGLVQGLPAQIINQFPAKKIKIIAITGTDGKTTTSTLIYHLLNQAGHKSGLISTVAAKIGNKDIATGLHVTVPSPPQMNRFLKQMVEANCEYVVIEMTSHGVYQFRDWGLKPIIAGLTNITHEHLDYHLDYNSYLAAKALLLKKSPIVVLNENDQSFYRIKQKLNLKRQKVLSYSLEEELPYNLKTAIKQKFSETYNYANARLAVKIVQELGVEDKTIAAAIKTFVGVPGRMEKLKIKKPFRVFVDFAHTPNALDEALGSLRQLLNKREKSGRLIALFGSAGHRDQSKRPMMGQAAVKHADIVVLTADDPRTENIWTIIQQIKSGIGHQQRKIISIADRRQALKFVFNELVEPGDIVGLMGKGPEESLAIGHREIPWSDKQITLEILQEA
jgi:UDP-N-acetylmuramoyl-L-alanyl-D-glutamate--2,6-diaminopimelate ligase